MTLDVTRRDFFKGLGAMTASGVVAKPQPESHRPDHPAFCFADKYTANQILQDPAAARSFEKEYLKSEANYFQVCHDQRTGLIFDGFDLNPQTGQPVKPRNWSAPSKECLDLGVLIKALEGDSKAAQVVGQGDAALAKQRAVQLLGQKMDSYREFQSQNPGYAGFLPWFFINSDKTVPTPDWKNNIPGLDNGEWMWTMLVAEKALRDSGHCQLAENYKNYNQMLQDNVVKVFYDPEGHACRGDVHIKDPSNPNTGYEPLYAGSYMTGEHGVHEGCMLIHYLTLLGKDLPEGAADRIWGNIHMKRVENPHGTTWQGFWGSAHESWAYLFLPFRDHQGYRDLFRIREEIRAENAVDRGYPGFGTSINGPRGGYISDAGIENIGTQPVKHNDTFAVYGVFPMLFQFAQHAGPGNFGLAWLHNMLTAPRMEGPLGGGESGTNDGQAFSAMKTTDGTLPNIIALMGGLEKETADVLKEKGVYQQFLQRIDNKYQETFGTQPLREPSPCVAPTKTVPREPLGDYF